MLALLDGEGIGRCALAGNSTGGVAAQIVAIEAPERVSALVLIGTGASTGGVPAGYRAEIDAWVDADPDGARSAALVRRLLARDPPPERMAVFVDAVRRADRRHMVDTLERLLALDLRPRLHAVTARTLVIRGSLDAARTPEHVRDLLAGIDGAVAIEMRARGIRRWSTARPPCSRSCRPSSTASSCPAPGAHRLPGRWRRDPP